MREHVGGGGVGGHQVETMHDAVHPRGVVHARCAIGLHLAITIVARTNAEVVSETGGDVGVVDQATRREELFVREVVFLSGETG